MGKAEGITQKKPVQRHWNKAELEKREIIMEKRCPGYFDRKLTMQVFLGTVLFIRGFYVLLSGLLQVHSLWQVVMMALGLWVSFLYYTLLIRGHLGWLAAVLLVLRCGELIYTVYSSLEFLFYMNLTGTCWWVTSMMAILSDTAFLVYLQAGKKAKILKFDNRILYSDSEISVSDEVI